MPVGAGVELADTISANDRFNLKCIGNKQPVGISVVRLVHYPRAFAAVLIIRHNCLEFGKIFPVFGVGHSVKIDRCT